MSKEDWNETCQFVRKVGEKNARRIAEEMDKYFKESVDVNDRECG